MTKIISKEISSMCWTVGVQFLAGAGMFSFCDCIQTSSGAHPVSYEWVPGALSFRIKCPGMMLITHFLLMPRLGMHGAMPSLPHMSS